MTYRPRSSVTTILANLVGSSAVSAMTQTPASGPFGPVTTPPRSAAPIVTAAAGRGCALSTAEANIRHAAMAITATAGRGLRLVFISSPSDQFTGGSMHRLPCGRLGHLDGCHYTPCAEVRGLLCRPDGRLQAFLCPGSDRPRNRRSAETGLFGQLQPPSLTNRRRMYYGKPSTVYVVLRGQKYE